MTTRAGFQRSEAFRQATVLDTDKMGPGIAATVALGGVPVVIFGRNLDSARHGLRMARKSILLLEEHALVAVDRANWALENLSESTQFEDCVRASDLVIESMPEDVAVKQDLFCRLDAVADENTVLASNTSALPVAAVASTANRNPTRILNVHFWHPAHLMPLVEIVPGEQTNGDVIARVRDFLRSCGKVPVLLRRDRPGQIGTRLQSALMREAMYIVQEGIADPADVDLAARTGFGLRLPVYGIFEQMDDMGLDMTYSVVGYVARDLYNEPDAPSILADKINRGETGAQAARGFYNWEVRGVRAMRERRDEFLLDLIKRYNPGR